MKWYYKPGHPYANERGFVEASKVHLVEDSKALHAPIMVDRFYENTKATDGTDIGSRRKHREYMKRHGLAMADDFSKTWAKDAENREKMQRGDFDHRDRREAVERALYESQRRR